jgi:GDP-L-fucose synthase
VTEKAVSKGRVLVTGATGFLGKFVVRELKQAGYEVSETSKSLGYDLRNEAEALMSVWLARPDTVVHLARTQANTPDTRGTAFRDTLLMNLNVAHATTMARAKLVTVAHPSINSGVSMLNGEASGQITLGALLRHYEAQYGLESRSLVFSELYGPFMRPQEGFLDVLTLINTFLLAKLRNQPTVILSGTGEAKRQLLCVTDAAKAVLKACEKPMENGYVFLAGKDMLKEHDLVDMVTKACQYEGMVEWDGEDQSPFRPPPLDAPKENELGIVPQMSLEHGLATMVAMRLETAGVKGGGAA